MADYTAAAELMCRSAGSFFRKIAEAWFLADHLNRAALESAFQVHFERYAALARGMQQ